MSATLSRSRLVIFTAVLSALGGSSYARSAESSIPDAGSDALPPAGQAANPADLHELSGEVAALKKQVADQQAALAAALARDEETRANAEIARLQDQEQNEDRPSLKLYGFLDAGIQRMWLKKDDPMAGLYSSKKLTFVPGSMNVYFDGRPGPGWRALLETRFTFYPGGNTVSNGLNITPVDNRVYDVTSPSGYNKVMWGGVVIERAQMEWTTLRYLKVRVGYFLTPYGIWNVDHGSPTLIALVLPQFQVEDAIPQRQAGVQVFGNVNHAPWNFGYLGYVSNGRTMGLFDLSDNKAFGGRLFVQHLGEAMTTLGSSVFVGDFEKEQVNASIDAVYGFKVSSTKTVRAHEWAVGLDLSSDWKGLRFRSEALLHHVGYDRGFHEPAAQPGTTKPNRYEHYGYGLVAYRLGKYVEPYLYSEFKYGSPAYTVSAWTQTFSGGLNLHFTAFAMLKSQFSAYRFIDSGIPSSPNARDFNYFTSRFIVVF